MKQVSIIKSGARATISANRSGTQNSIRRVMLDELSDGLNELAADSDITVIVLTGGVFAAAGGFDADGARAPIAGARDNGLEASGNTLMALVESVPKIVLGSVSDHCFADALALLLACDLIVTAADAELGDTHAKWGVSPSWGLSQRLPRRVGVMRARELSYTARTFNGADALAMGLANYAPPAAELDACIDRLCERLMQNNTSVLAAYKDLYRAAENFHLIEALDYESETDYPVA